MSERISEFTPEEAIWIAEYAKEIAGLGPDAIDDLARKKIQLSMNSYNALNTAVPNQAAVNLGNILMHEVRVVDEILRQSRAVRQLTGVDELSELDRSAQEEGLGSIFDENSPIGQRLKKYL